MVLGRVQLTLVQDRGTHPEQVHVCFEHSAQQVTEAV